MHKNLISLNLLPFIDILMSVIGIFVIVFALKAVGLRVVSESPTADAMFITETNNEITWMSSGSPDLRTAYVNKLPELLKELRERHGRSPNLVIGVTPSGILSSRKLKETLRGFPHRVMWVPLSGIPKDTDVFVEKWRNEFEAAQ